MNFIKLTFFILFMLAMSGIVNGQTVLFGANNATGYSKTGGTLWCTAYNDTDTGLFLIYPDGKIGRIDKDLLITPVDSAIFATNYRVDTAKSNIRNYISTYLAKYSDTGSVLASKSFASKSKYYGTLYSKYSWSDLSDFTVNGATASVSGGAINFSGGTGSFTQTLDYNYYTDLEHWDMTSVATTGSKTSSSNGFGVGIRSAGGYMAVQFIANTTSDSGKIRIISTVGTAAISTSRLSWTAGDKILLHIERFNNTAAAYAINYTTKSAPIYVSFTFPLSYGATSIIPPIGKFSVYSFGGSFSLDSLHIASSELKNANLCIIGDSKSVGYVSSDFSKTFYYKLKLSMPNTIISAGAGEKTLDVLNKMGEILTLHPKQVLLNIGRNDVASGVDSNTWRSRYQRIVDTLEQNGIEVYHLLPMPESSLNQSSIKDWIIATYATDKIIDCWTPLTGCGASCIGADGIHPSDSGMNIVYNTIMDFDKLYGAANIYEYIPKYKDTATLIPSTYQLDTAKATIRAQITSSIPTIDSSVWQTKYRSDTARTNIYTAIAGKVPASFTSGYIPYASSSIALSSSVLYQTSSKILVGTTTSGGSEVLQVNGNARVNDITIGHTSDAGTLEIGSGVLGNSGGPCVNAVYIGTSAGLNANSTYGCGIGYLAGNRDRGNYNFFLGPLSGPQTAGHNLTGQQNVGVGYYALNGIQDGANYNLAVGTQAGQLISTGNKNVLIGTQAGAALTTVDGCVMIGYTAGATETAANKLYIDNTNTSSPLIYGDFSTDSLQFNGKTTFTSKSYWSATNTAGGTTGNQTINKPSGTVNVAAGGTAITVTNSLVTSNSIVFAVIRTNDATAAIKNVVPTSGSFTINLSAAVTGETSIGFFVIN